MKKIIIALLCMVIATGVAMAQKQFTFGPKVGVDYTHYWGKDAYHKGQLNYQVGMFLEYRMSSKFAIAPEVVFAAQGGKYDYDDVDEETSKPIKCHDTDHVNYINVPFMLKYYIVPEFSIDFGPQIGCNVYSKYTEEIKGEGIDTKETYDQKDDTKALDFGIGLGMTYNIAKEVFVQCRYTMGIGKAYEYGNFRNGNAQISIGYRF